VGRGILGMLIIRGYEAQTGIYNARIRNEIKKNIKLFYATIDLGYKLEYLRLYRE